MSPELAVRPGGSGPTWRRRWPGLGLRPAPGGLGRHRRPPHRTQRLRRAGQDGLAGMGVTEVQTYPFLSQAAFDRLELPADDPRRRTLRLANPISEEARAAHHPAARPGQGGRSATWPGGLDGVAVYELRAVFTPVREGALPDEPLTLGVLLTGQAPAGRFDDPRRPFDFADARAWPRAGGRLGVPGVGYRAENTCLPPEPLRRCAPGGPARRSPGPAPPARGGRLELPAACRGRAGAGPAADRGAADAPGADAVALPGELTFDVAFPGPAGRGQRRLEAALREAGGDLLTRLTLFDAYEGPPLPRAPQPRLPGRPPGGRPHPHRRRRRRHATAWPPWPPPERRRSSAAG